MRQESIIDYTKTNIRGDYASLDDFHLSGMGKSEKRSNSGSAPVNRELILRHCKEDQNMSDVDDFDFICHVAYDKKPLTR